MAFRYSNFPQSVDKLKRLPEYQELSYEDKSYVARYTELCQKGASMTTQDKLEFNDLLTNKLRDKMIQSIDWNLMADAITNIEDFYLNHVLRDISDLVNRKEQEFTNYIDDKTNYFDNKLSRFSYKGEYSTYEQYEKWNTVTFKNNTYMCKKPSTNILPTDNEEYWNMVAKHGDGLKWRMQWSPMITYQPLDVVKHGNSLFICMLSNYNKIPTSHTSENNQYWDLMFTTDRDFKENEYYRHYKSLVNIQHDLNCQPMVQAISQYTYGHGGYGMFGLYNNYQLNNLVEYIDKNNIRIHFVESFNGNPNVTKINEREYVIKFSLEDTEIHLYLFNITN